MFCSGCGKQLPNGSTFCSGCGKRLNIVGAKLDTSANKGLINSQNGAVYSIDGVRGKHIDIYESKCVIKNKVTFGSLMFDNATDGEKTIYYKDCVGIQFKKAGFGIGFLQFETASGLMNNKMNNFAGENSFPFDGSKISNEKMEEIANYVRQRIDEIKTRDDKPITVVQSTTSVADELKKMKELVDLGIITQEEFEIKKRQLLNL